MAHPKIINQSDCFIWFSLSNKPEYICVLDRKDYFDLVENSRSWYIHISNKKKSATPYIRRANGMNQIHLHREILGLKGIFTSDPKEKTGDHINGDGLDNRRSNLRSITFEENTRRGRCAGIEYLGFRINYIKTRNAFQSYKSLKFVASGKSLEIVKSKIDKLLEAVQ